MKYSASKRQTLIIAMFAVLYCIARASDRLRVAAETSDDQTGRRLEK
jgi:hypothetical protein